VRIRALAVAGAAAIAAVALAVPSADAGNGPPPPTSTNGHKVHLFASGVMTPTSFAFGAGQVFEGDGGNSEGNGPPNGGVYVLQNGQAHKLRSALKFVAGLVWHDNALYVSGARLEDGNVQWVLMRWSGWNGKTLKRRDLLYIAPKRFQGFNGLGFGANGRLFVGVDVGLLDGNDHGPSNTSPLLYDILTFNPDGSAPAIFAHGIRQPWQFAFAKGSSSPYVTDLGQDSGAKNPPDFILHARRGQHYGFPKCNHTKAKPCTGFAKPYRSFKPHTDLMGIALNNSKFYLTSFAGTNGSGQGEVLTMGLHQHKLHPLITGFVAPTVGLGYHRGWVYVGELTGQVYRLRV
jgi:glucose/arabinose dehydrogenase